MGNRNNIIKLILIVLIIALLIFLGFRIFMPKTKKLESFTEITLQKYKELMSSKEKAIIYISSEKDGSKEYEENIKTILEDEDKTIYYLNLSKLKGEEIVTFMNVDDLTKDDYVEPMILVVKDGKVSDKILGVVSKTELISFFEKHKD